MLIEPCDIDEREADLSICTTYSWCWLAVILQFSLGLALLVYLFFHGGSWYEDFASKQKQRSSTVKEQFVALAEDADEMLTERSDVDASDAKS